MSSGSFKDNVTYKLYIYIYMYKHDLVGKLFGFNGISTSVNYLMPNPFHTNNQFYFKEFSLAWVHSLIVKNISISIYSV